MIYETGTVDFFKQINKHILVFSSILSQQLLLLLPFVEYWDQVINSLYITALQIL